MGVMGRGNACKFQGMTHVSKGCGRGLGWRTQGARGKNPIDLVRIRRCSQRLVRFGENGTCPLLRMGVFLWGLPISSVFVRELIACLDQG